jgi:hypothetical protein
VNIINDTLIVSGMPTFTGQTVFPSSLSLHSRTNWLEHQVNDSYGVEYFTLQEAINAITSNGQEVTLLMDITEPEINITNYSVTVKANGYNCAINQLNIGNGKSFEWVEDTLNITGAINNNTSGVLINKAVIINTSFNNTGIYKGTGQFIGNFTNQNLFIPGN